MTPRRLTPFRQALRGLALGVAYGLVCRLLFDPRGDPSTDSLRVLLAIMSVSFIFALVVAPSPNASVHCSRQHANPNIVVACEPLSQPTHMAEGGSSESSSASWSGAR